jgi:hypothetical protein
METITTVIKSPECIFSQSKEQSVEADLILPDYYPEISKILDCTVRLSEEAVTVAGDKISVAGAADVRLLYTSGAQELSAYRTVAKYTCVFTGENFASADTCLVRQNTVSLNFRAVSPRKAEVRAVAAVSAEVYRMCEQRAVTDADDARVQKKTAECPCFAVSAFSSARFELTEKLSLPAPKDRIACILRENARITWSEVRASHHKVLLSGVAEISFVYVSREGQVSQECSVNLPFTQIKDVYGAEESDICRVGVSGVRFEIDLKHSGTDANEAQALLTAGLTVICGKNETLRLIEDAYCWGAAMDIKKAPLSVPRQVQCETSAVSFSGEAASYDIDIAEICDKSVSDIVCSAARSDAAVRVSGSLNVKALTRSGDGAYYCFSRNCSFEASLPGIPGGVCGVYAEPNSLFAEKGAEGKLNFGGDLRLTCICLPCGTVQGIAQLGIDETEPPANEERMILYYGEKGESVWEIAKENRTDLAALRDLNAIEGERLPENRLLIFRA